MRRLLTLFTLLQTVLAGRVLLRMVRTAGGTRVAPVVGSPGGARVSVIVPVLDEAVRLGPCLDGLIGQGDEVAEILVVDGGSSDGTVALAQDYAERDPRVRVIVAGPAPAGRNGKAYNLEAGYRQAEPGSNWVLTIDADVRPAAGLVAALLARAESDGLAVLSAATRQRLADVGDGLIHPAMLATLVYRFGIPGSVTTDPRAVQANGQCMLIRRTALHRVGGFAAVQTSICEDVTLARDIAARGERVGFAEAGDLVAVEMYADWRQTWRNWSRSLPMHDRHSRVSAPLGLLEVTLVQALPLPLALVGRRLAPHHPLTWLNTVLVAVRLGTLAGMRRAYIGPPFTYWLSPGCDLPVALRLWLMLLRRRHVWRGRTIERGGTE